jgi:hypothetical protein
MNSRHIAFIAYEAVRAHKRVIDPKSAGPYWYDLEDPAIQDAFQVLIDQTINGDWRDFGSPEANALVYAVIHALHPAD